MSALAMVRLESRRLFVRPLAWVLGALTLGELAWRFVLLLGNFLAAQVKLAALPAGPGYTDLVAVPLLSSLFTGGLVPFGLAELALLVVPLLTMSSIAGERSNGTLPLLLASGLSPTRIVLGKYLAVLGWLALWLALGTHLEPLLRGLVATDDVLWFVLLAALALALAIRRLGSDRERG